VLFSGAADLGRIAQSISPKRAALTMRYSRISRLKATTHAVLAAQPGTEAGHPSRTEATHPRHCLECGKPIVHRRITALYCSGKCREIHNAQKRRQVRHDTIDTLPATSEPNTEPNTEA
jgi:predicted nucleic acid-binding Zn ribbon protein